MSARSRAKATTTRPPSTSKERGRVLGTKIRTTIEPGKVLEVGDAELVDLHRQHLLHSHEGNENTKALGLGKSLNKWHTGKAEVIESGVITDPQVEDDDEDEGASDSEGSKE